MLLLEAFHWSQLLQPQFYIENGGLWLLLFIVFAETGLFAGFFLPGDSLLFVAGIYATKMGDGTEGLAYQFLKIVGLGHVEHEFFQLMVLTVIISIAGILGNFLGYWTGRKIGPSMFNWRDRLLFKKKYLYDAHDFYEKHGALAIIAARFLPLIRTFAPIVAGIVKMEYKKFVLYNIIGSFLWVFSMLFAGHYLQKWIMDGFGYDLKEHLEIIVIAIIAVTTAPVFYKILTSKDRKKKIVTEEIEEN